MKKLVVTPEELYPGDLLYWRRMGSREGISRYFNQVPEERRLVIIPWGVLEAHGPFLPTGSDSMLASVVADELAFRLIEHNVRTVIIFDAFNDIGVPSATQGFPGSVEYSPDIVVQLWVQTLNHLVNEGFRKFILINGDGGNWFTLWAQLKCATPAIVSLIRSGVVLEGMNFDQVGEPYPHGGTFYHACFKWLVDFAPRRIRTAALRHGFQAAPEVELLALGKVPPIRPPSEPPRWALWDMYPAQQHLRCINGFDPDLYRTMLYDAAGEPLTEGGISADFELKLGKLLELTRWVMEQPTRR